MHNVFNVAVSGIPGFVENHSSDFNLSFCKNLLLHSNNEKFYNPDFLYEKYVNFIWKDYTIDFLELLDLDLSKNDVGQKINEILYKDTMSKIKLGHVPIIIGGAPNAGLGAIEAVSKKWPFIDVVHLGPKIHFNTPKMEDKWSESSYMFNLCFNVPNIKNMLLVGAKNIIKEEAGFVENINKESQDLLTMHMQNFGTERPFVWIKSEKDLLRASFYSNWNCVFEKIFLTTKNPTWLSIDMAIFEEDNMFCKNNFELGLFLLKNITEKGNVIGCNISNSKSSWELNKTSETLYGIANYIANGYGR